jgi:hypothetical protein
MPPSAPPDPVGAPGAPAEAPPVVGGFPTPPAPPAASKSPEGGGVAPPHPLPTQAKTASEAQKRDVTLKTVFSL